MNIDDNTKTIEKVMLLHKQKSFRSIFQLAVTSSTDVFNLKSTFRTLSKTVYPVKNGNNASATLAQQNTLYTFQYLREEKETVEIQRQKHWERNRVFQEQGKKEKKRENEKREKEKRQD